LTKSRRFVTPSCNSFRIIHTSCFDPIYRIGPRLHRVPRGATVTSQPWPECHTSVENVSPQITRSSSICPSRWGRAKPCKLRESPQRTSTKGSAVSPGPPAAAEKRSCSRKTAAHGDNAMVVAVLRHVSPFRGAVLTGGGGNPNELMFVHIRSPIPSSSLRILLGIFITARIVIVRQNRWCLPSCRTPARNECMRTSPGLRRSAGLF